jgi:hypothetical protein
MCALFLVLISLSLAQIVPCTPTAVSPSLIGSGFTLQNIFAMRTHAIVLASNASNDDFVFAVEYATGLRTVTDGSGLAVRTLVSPDNDILAVLYRFPDRRLFSMDATGTSRRQLSPAGVEKRFCVSFFVVCFFDFVPGR